MQGLAPPRRVRQARGRGIRGATAGKHGIRQCRVKFRRFETGWDSTEFEDEKDPGEKELESLLIGTTRAVKFGTRGETLPLPKEAL